MIICGVEFVALFDQWKTTYGCLQFRRIPMRHSCSAPVLLVLAAVAGYALGTPPVRAQPQPLPFAIGDTVTISLQGGTTRCRIEEIRGTFARCADPSGPPVGGYGVRQPADQSSWVNLAVVEWVTKPGEQR